MSSREKSIDSGRRGKQIWIAWFAVLTLLAIGLAYEIRNIFLEYQSEPTSVSVFEKVPPRLPSVLVCPPSWLNRTKLSEIGDAHELEMLIQSYFLFEMSPEGLESVEAIIPNIHIMANNSASLEQRMKAAKGTTDIGQKLIDKYRNLLSNKYHPFNQMIKYFQTDGLVQGSSLLSETNTQKYTTAFGGCYRVTATTNVTALELMLSSLTVYINYTAHSVPKWGSTLYAFFGDAAMQSFPFGYRINIPLGVHSTILVKAIHFARVSVKRQSCKL